MRTRVAGLSVCRHTWAGRTRGVRAVAGGQAPSHSRDHSPATWQVGYLPTLCRRPASWFPAPEPGRQAASELTHHRVVTLSLLECFPVKFDISKPTEAGDSETGPHCSGRSPGSVCPLLGPFGDLRPCEGL